MKIKKLIFQILLLLVVLGVALYFAKIPVQSPVLDEQNNIEVVGEIYTYTNASTSQQLKVSYDNTNDTATIYPDEMNRVVFNATTTGSGARYANDEQGLILWNKGDEVSLYLNDSLIFTGITPSKSIEEATSTQSENL